MTRYCDDEVKCRNAGVDCHRCIRSYGYEESGDWFDEIEEGDEPEK